MATAKRVRRPVKKAAVRSRVTTPTTKASLPKTDMVQELKEEPVEPTFDNTASTVYTNPYTSSITSEIWKEIASSKISYGIQSADYISVQEYTPIQKEKALTRAIRDAIRDVEWYEWSSEALAEHIAFKLLEDT